MNTYLNFLAPGKVDRQRIENRRVCEALERNFQANYERAPFRCGYVMWLRDQAGKTTVLRLEDGIISHKEAGAMTLDELAQSKQQFRCFAP